jgi:hypothetical protein
LIWKETTTWEKGNSAREHLRFQFVQKRRVPRRERSKKMSDYIPNPPNPDRDPRNYDRYYEDNSGRGLTLVIGILVAIALVAGLMFFAGNRGERVEQAQAPVERTVNPPGNPPGNPAGKPATPALPPGNSATPTNPTAPRQ